MELVDRFDINRLTPSDMIPLGAPEDDDNGPDDGGDEADEWFHSGFESRNGSNNQSSVAVTVSRVYEGDS